MEDQNKCIMKDMEETRSSLTEKLEALESKVAEKVQPVAAAVERATEAAADLVEEVRDTVHEVKEKVQDTVHGVKETVQETVKKVSSAFDLRRHTERHPWLMMGLAATTGCVLGKLIRPRSPTPPPSPAPVRPRHGKGGGNGWAHRAEAHKPEAPARETLFAEELRQLKGLAVGALLGVLRDLAKQNIPGTLGSRLAEELDSLTTRLGVEPIPSPVLGEALQRQPACIESDGEGSAEVNRLRSGPPGAELY
jgi:ElaB/YqjD/DUF883 family membrane-anchored ribosome-binding protein